MSSETEYQFCSFDFVYSIADHDFVLSATPLSYVKS